MLLTSVYTWHFDHFLGFYLGVLLYSHMQSSPLCALLRLNCVKVPVIFTLLGYEPSAYYPLLWPHLTSSHAIFLVLSYVDEPASDKGMLFLFIVLPPLLIRFSSNYGTLWYFHTPPPYPPKVISVARAKICCSYLSFPILPDFLRMAKFTVSGHLWNLPPIDNAHAEHTMLNLSPFWSELLESLMPWNMAEGN